MTAQAAFDYLAEHGPQAWAEHSYEEAVSTFGADEIIAVAKMIQRQDGCTHSGETVVTREGLAGQYQTTRYVCRHCGKILRVEHR